MIEKKRLGVILFWVEFAFAVHIPFIICYINTPTNILNSTPSSILDFDFWLNAFADIGICGFMLMFFAGVFIGIVGIVKARTMGKLKIAMTLLSILNLSVGFVENLAIILVFCAVLFGGVSV